MERRWYLGLDMGTSSVGWAVTNEKYELLRLKGKDAWGIREFEEAQVAVERRTHRTSRRRHQREVFRIGMLKELFADAINCKDPNFYARLDNSKYYLEDKDENVKNKNGIFNDAEYSDVDYFKQYPTIFHLRSELIHNKDEHDVRLIYLALLHMFKHRGHFLNAGLSSNDNERKIEEIYQDFCIAVEETLEIVFPCDIDSSIINEIIGNKNYSKTKKTEELVKELSFDKAKKKEIEILKAICGRKVDAKNIFSDIELENDKKIEICFSDFGYDEKKQEILDSIGEEAYRIVELMKEIYDCGLYAGIMQGESYLSDARINSYKKHKSDLRLLKSVVKKCGTMEDYNTLFRSEETGTYSAYVNSYNSGRKQRRDFKSRKQEDLYGTIRKLLTKYQKEHADDESIASILEEISNESFLPKQMSASNGVIPMQAHLKEMVKILKNAEGYLPFLTKKDESNLTISEKIIELFKFQIPYYIGPTSLDSVGSGKNGWVIRKNGHERSKVLPWTFEKVIDTKATSEKFIERMVRRCTYVEGESVLPKSSLMYERFKVLNEINNIRIKDQRISVEVKQELFRNLYETKSKVTKKKICEFFFTKGLVENETDITGIDISINNQLSSYGKFYGIFGDKIREDTYKKVAEDIIYWCTVYGDSKSFLKGQLMDKYPDIFKDEKLLKKILGFKFKDWGNLSKRFLELEGINKETGEVTTIIRALWESQYNLMELINSQDYTFSDSIEEIEKNTSMSLTEMKAEDLDDLYFSAPVKRMVWQTIHIIKELETIIGCPPEKVFIEMTRSEDKEKKRTNSRKQQFIDLYKNIKDEVFDWKGLIEREDASGRLKSKKMYLYLTQMGKCMYTGDSIELDDLFNDNLYDIDHIYPRHFVKDDNINNNLVLVKKEKNAHKSDEVLSYEIQSKMMSTWKYLHQKGLINDEKFRRLCRKDEFSPEEKAGFIARQLVETSQGTKGVADLLKKIMPESELIYSKASVVSEFRHHFDLPKCRCINEFHHANDAYLNIVVGNVYNTKFTKNPINFIKNEYLKDKVKYNYNMDKMFDKDVERNGDKAWIVTNKENGECESIVTVKKMMAKNTPLMTRYSFEGHGGIANETLYSKNKAKPDAYIPFKTNDLKLQDVTKYGGFSSVSTAYFFLVEHEQKGKTVRTLETVPVYLKGIIDKNIESLESYCRTNLGLINPSVRFKKIKIQSLIKLNGYYVYLSGKTNVQVLLRNAVNLALDIDNIKYLKKIEKSICENKVDESICHEKNMRLYEEYINKHENTIVAKRPNPMAKLLTSGKEQFERLDLEKQINVIYEINNLSKVGITVANLKDIGGASISGKMLNSKNITSSKEFKLINQSITGLYLNEIDLLKV